MGYCCGCNISGFADCNEWEEIADYAKEQKDFLKKFLKLTGGIPSSKTYERVISFIKSWGFLFFKL